MSLSRHEQNKLDSQIVQVHSGLGQVSRLIDTLEETIAEIDDADTFAEDWVTPIATSAEREAIRSQLEAWADVMQTRWLA